MRDQTAQIEWRENGTPVSMRFDDPYFSLAGGLDETHYVFLQGNSLPARFCDGFHIAELGFGTGLNLLAAVSAFRASNQSGKLHFTSFEAFPMTPSDMAQALGHFPGLDTGLITEQWTGETVVLTAEDVTAEIIIGDARQTLPNWEKKADAWFLDGFSPDKNPELWSAEIMREVGAHTTAGGTFATYTAAGHVRRSLTDAGFTVERVKGFGRKRHMSRGVRQ
ncbi:MAG: tRNA (5-methylaminomethyl-2-thiouridine)(34)-methyltransferase MnmD [Litoreibacter sp.]